MRKLLFALCIFIMCGCSSVEKIDEGELVHYFLGDDSDSLYGGFRIVESWNGFKLEEYDFSNTIPNAIFTNDDFSIIKEGRANFDYVYKDGSKEVILHSRSASPKLFVEPAYSNAFQIDDQVYFFYYDIFDLVVNVVEDGKLIEYKRIPLEDDEYVFRNYLFNDYEMYSIYKNENAMKYVCDEREYIFNIFDEVIVLKDYILYSTYDSKQVTGSYIINRKTNESIQLNKPIDFHLEASEQESYDYYFNRFKNNSVIFVEKVDNQMIYYYGTIVDNLLKKIELPYSYSETDLISLYDEKTIFLSKNENDFWNRNHYIIEIK